MQASSTIWSSSGSSTATAIASVGQTRTQARHADAELGVDDEIQRPAARGEDLQFDGSTRDCQDIGVCKVCVQLELAACIGCNRVAESLVPSR